MENETEKKRILIVDDEQDVISVVKVILEKEGYEVVGVLNGKEALKEIGADNFSLIVLDIMMPDMTGWDLFTHIIEDNTNQKVIFLSVVNVSEERLKELKESGIKDYIKKPFDKDDFLARVKKVLAD